MKPQNIGFDSNGTLKLFDFGLAACVKRTQLATDAYEMTGFTGTLAYMAPEVVLRLPYNEKVDVYSFSIILWQMLSGQMPFKGMTREEHLQQVARDGQRPSLANIMSNSKIPLGMILLLEKCWHADYSLRPDFKSILLELKSFKEASQSISNRVISLKNYFFPRRKAIMIGPDDVTLAVTDDKKAFPIKMKPSHRSGRLIRSF